MKKEVLKILTHLKQESENGKDLGFYKYQSIIMSAKNQVFQVKETNNI